MRTPARSSAVAIQREETCGRNRRLTPMSGHYAYIGTGRGGPTMMARMGFMKALHRNVPRVLNPDRKDTHWGKRELKRDQ